MTLLGIVLGPPGVAQQSAKHMVCLTTEPALYLGLLKCFCFSMFLLVVVFLNFFPILKKVWLCRKDNNYLSSGIRQDPKKLAFSLSLSLSRFLQSTFHDLEFGFACGGSAGVLCGLWLWRGLTRKYSPSLRLWVNRSWALVFFEDCLLVFIV